MHDIVKTFGGSPALKGMHFALKRGEIHALMGENGAGKSTFIKIITGVYQPDSGTMLYDGKPLAPKSTVESQKLGIAAIYQHVTSFPDLSVTENIFMGQELKTKWGTYDWARMHRIAKEQLAPFSPDIDVKKPMSSLSVAQQQMVEIAKALSRHARLLILDEPTASLTAFECERLYEIVEKLRDDGISMIFITHRFEDMYRLASRVTVLRDGQYIGTWDIDAISHDELIHNMVGRKLENLYPPRRGEIGQEIFRVEGLCKQGYFRDISFGVRQGEIVVLTGLVGAGRTEVCRAIYGNMRPDSGKVLLEGKELNIRSSAEALEAGIGLLPEDRLLQGLLGQMPITRNVSAASLDKLLRHGFLSEKAETDTAVELCTKLRLKAKNVAALPSSLSGGNQQKVVLAKLLNCDLKVLILDEPTKGIDVGAKNSVYEIIRELAENGHAILMVSSEMPEVLGMADRILVMRTGRIVAEMDAAEATQEKILAASLMHKDTEVTAP